MKVFNLRCVNQHLFEGWFGSEDDFQTQLTQGLLECPLCGDKTIHKGLSAPRLNLGATRPTTAPDAQTDTSPAATASTTPTTDLVAGDAQLRAQAAWLVAARELLARTEDVGQDFAQEARRIHYGEAQERGIRGQASQEETRALLDEGINVLPLTLPKALKGPLH